MASSGSISGSFNGTSTNSISFRVDWKVTSQDTATRTSTVQFKYICRRSSTQRTTYKDDAPWSLSASGTVTGTVDFDIRNTAINTDYVFLTRNRNIQHDANGTKTLTVSGYIDLSGTSAGTGSFSQSITLPTIPVAPPTVDSFTISDAGNSIQAGLYVASQSIIKLDATATAQATGATISKYEFYRNDALIYSGASGTYTEPSPAVAGSYTYKCIVYDSYGLTATDTLAAITVEAYSLPVITSTTTFRSDSGGTASSSGAYASATAVWTFSSLGGVNVATGTAVANGYSVSLTSGTPGVVGSGTLAPTSAWTIIYTVTDSFGNSATKSDIIYSAFRNFNLAPDKTSGGFAFGEIAEVGKGKFNNVDLLARQDMEVVGDLTAGSLETNSNVILPDAEISNAGTNLAFDQKDGSYTDSFNLPQSSGLSANGSYEIITTKPTDSWSGTWSSNFTTCKCFSSMTVGSSITIEWKQFGKLVCAVFKVSRAAATAAGSSVFEANIRSAYLPVITVCSAGYYSSSGVIAKYDTNGTFTCRVIGAQLAASNTVQIGMTFMLA